MSIQNLISRHKASIKKLLDFVGYDYTNWNRVELYKFSNQFLNTLDTANLDVLEISSGNYYKDNYKFNSYTEANFPEFDVCKDTLEDKYDLIIADQVFEHLLHPYSATKNVFSMLKPEEFFLFQPPFLSNSTIIPTTVPDGQKQD